MGVLDMLGIEEVVVYKALAAVAIILICVLSTELVVVCSVF